MSMLHSYGKQALLPSFFVGICYGFLSFFFLNRKQQTKPLLSPKLLSCYRGSCATVLTFYIYILINIVFLSREPGPIVVNLKFLGTYHGEWCLIYLIENAIMLLPLGFLIPKVMPCFQHWWATLLLGLLASASIELTQYYTRLGYLELDDLWTNVLGCYAGYLLHLISYLPLWFSRKSSAKKQKNQTSH